MLGGVPNPQLKQLYQDVILDHNRNPRNYKEIEPCSISLQGHNPLCGDSITLYLKVEDSIIIDVGFLGQGCAISKASASMLTKLVKGASVQEAREVIRTFTLFLTNHSIDCNEGDPNHHKIFNGVRQFPIRVKCATLAWRTMEAAITQHALKQGESDE